jgi:hypothetical protein
MEIRGRFAITAARQDAAQPSSSAAQTAEASESL